MANKPSSRSSQVKGTIIVSFIKALGFLPLPISQSITGFIAWLSYQTNSTSRKVTEVNLQLCYPKLSAKERACLTRKSIKASGMLMAEAAKIWTQPIEKILTMISHVEGEELINNLNKNSTKGTLVISPHLGNWEFIYPYLAHHFIASGLYRPPKIAELATLILAGRAKALAGRTDNSGQIIKASHMEVRKMLRVLKNAEILVMLPDQQPQHGSGVFAPFYGHQAYTMTLLQGLVQRTGASIIMATCIRSNAGFKLTFSPVDIDPSLTNELFAEQLNSRMQHEIDKTPEQYEWAYKRFKATPEGVGSRYD